jgi:hypothetical protein
LLGHRPLKRIKTGNEIAFGNVSSSDCTTEKFIELFLPGTIPAYWGEPPIHRGFNANSFINFFDHECSFEALAEHVAEAARNDDLSQPWDYILKVFSTILHKTSKKPQIHHE